MTSLFDSRRLALAALAFSIFGVLEPVEAATPTISGQPRTWILAGSSYEFRPAVANAGTRKVTFQVANKPAWASFEKTTGRLYGATMLANVGKYNGVAITATVGTIKVALPPFGIRVARPNRAPIMSGTPKTLVNVGQAYSFQPGASDADGNSLTFSVQNKPIWMSFRSSTGLLSGTPTAAGTFANIVVSVSDGKVSASLAAFTVTVIKPNTAPVISGTPSMSTFVNTAYSFKPAASDADGNALTFSIQNKPSWATFDVATGLLSGTPTAAGQFSNLTISVSDGKVSTALAPFNLTASPVVTASVTLHWVAPTENVDGTPLNDLAGFRVLYGTSPTALDQTLELPSPEMTSVVIEELHSDTYYFAVKAYTSDSVESDISELLWKAIM